MSGGESRESGKTEQKGYLITIEGIEGSGKTTLTREIGHFIKAGGQDVICTYEPGGGARAGRMREILFEEGGDRDPVLATLLFCAARRDHIITLIRPALARCTWVICDRFMDSTLAYQVSAQGMDRSLINRLHEVCLEDLRPDITFILDLDPQLGLERCAYKPNPLKYTGIGGSSYEEQALDFHQKVRDAFLEIARDEPDRCLVLDARLDPPNLLKKALAALMANPKIGAALKEVPSQPSSPSQPDPHGTQLELML